nr:hypothetical protein [Tanacetum cinerariifolium]
GELSKGKAKVAWKNVCKPKSVDGLGLKELEIWNKSTEDVNDSWGWRNILKLRDEVKMFLVMKIGNGEKAYVLYDNWCGIGTLHNFITSRDVYIARRNTDLVKDIVDNGKCKWPEEWVVKYPILLQHQNVKLDPGKMIKLFGNQRMERRGNSIHVLWKLYQ